MTNVSPGCVTNLINAIWQLKILFQTTEQTFLAIVEAKVSSHLVVIAHKAVDGGGGGGGEGLYSLPNFGYYYRDYYVKPLGPSQ